MCPVQNVHDVSVLTDTRVDAWWLHLTPFAAPPLCGAGDRLRGHASLEHAAGQSRKSRAPTEHPFKLFSACEDFEPAFQPATPALLSAFGAASYSRFSPILGCGS